MRTHTDAELPAVLELVADAFVLEPAIVGLVRDLAGDASFLPQFSLVAEDSGEIVGHVMLTRAEVGGADDSTLDVLLLAPLGVATKRQRTGVGTRLVTEAMDRARAEGEVAVFVLGDPAYYARFGFEPVMGRGILPPYPIEYEDAWMAMELVPGALSDRAGVVKMAAPFYDPSYW